MSPRKIKIITGPEKSILVRRRERTTLPAWLEHDIVTSVAGSGPCPASRAAAIHATVAPRICAFV